MDALDALLNTVLGKQEPITMYTHHSPTDYTTAELRVAFDVVEQMGRGPFFLLLTPGGKP